MISILAEIRYNTNSRCDITDSLFNGKREKEELFMGLSTGLRGHARDMTQGSPLKLIMWFSVPLFVGNIFQQVYSIVDTIVAGHNLGSGAVAAIGATSSIYSLIIGFLSGLNSGYGIVIARAFGAHKGTNYAKQLPQCCCSMECFPSCSQGFPYWGSAP